MRQALMAAQDSGLAELRNAMTALPGGDLSAWDVSQIRNADQIRASSDPHVEASRQRARAMANWEPAYAGEQIDYYQEFIHRHAPINFGWLRMPAGPVSDKEVSLEATGMGLLKSEYEGTERVVAPLDDGSICIWDVSRRSINDCGPKGRILGQSVQGLLSGHDSERNHPIPTSDSKIIMTETGAVECVSIDSAQSRGFFGVQSMLHEVDLQTLQLISSEPYPFPITALSEVSEGMPVTVGTNNTIHIHDARNKTSTLSTDKSVRTELIGGSAHTYALSQPGPLSILNQHNDQSIWVAGRFTSLLNYDRRFFPRLKGTLHSGARIACLTMLPHPYIPRNLDLMRETDVSIGTLNAAKSASGATLLAAGEYKGKGSLELYGLPQQAGYLYQNRQTASSSKLLSVAPHGGRIVYSDGDGNLKWVERDGYSHIRNFNINDLPNEGSTNDASDYGIWSSTASEMPGQGDIVQKMLPLGNSTSDPRLSGGRPDINQSDLLLWTGDGRIGVLGFGHDSQYKQEVMEQRTESAEQRAREDAEKQYGMAMRRALKRNADEMRFVKGLGMGYMRP